MNGACAIAEALGRLPGLFLDEKDEDGHDQFGLSERTTAGVVGLTAMHESRIETAWKAQNFRHGVGNENSCLLPVRSEYLRSFGRLC